MYRLGEVKHSHRKLYTWLAAVVIVVGLLIWWGVHSLKADTAISTPPAAITKTINYAATDLKTYNERLFTLKLPADWKLVPNTSEPPQPTYTWRGASSTNSSRSLALFIDSGLLSNFAVNRELYVEANGATVNVLSNVSDNCTTFTGVPGGQSKGNIPAKWQGITFLCDAGNYERDAVGVASPDGLNNVTLTGPVGGAHHIFFTYTDNSSSPDYTIFTNALKTFALK